MKIEKRALISAAFWLFLAQGIVYLAPLLVLPVLTRALSLSSFGVAMACIAAVQFCASITDFGFNLSATYKISVSEERLDCANHLARTVTTAKVILSLVASAAFAIVALYLARDESDYLEIVVYGVLAVIAQAAQASWLFQGMQKLAGYTVYTAASKVVYAVGVYLTVTPESGASAVLLCLFLSNLAAAVASTAAAARMGVKIRTGSLSEALDELKQSAHYFWSRLAVASYASTTTVLIGAIDARSAGLFASAEQIYKAVQNFSAPINQAIFPYMARTRDWKLFFRVLFVLGGITSILAILISLNAEIILGTFFGAEYLPAQKFLNIFMLLAVFDYLAIAVGYPACSALGKPEVANRSVVYGAATYATIILAMWSLGSLTPVAVQIGLFSTICVILVARLSFVLPRVFS